MPQDTETRHTPVPSSEKAAAGKARSIVPVILVLFSLSILGVAVGSAFFIFSMQNQADSDLKKRIEIALNIETVRQQDLLEEYSYWDEAYDRTVVEFDREWIDENFRDYLTERYGFDFIFAAPGGRAPTEMIIREDATPVEFEELKKHGLDILMGKCRSAEHFSKILSTYIKIPSGTYLISAGPFIDETLNTARPDYSFLVYGRKLGDEYLDSVGSTYKLPKLTTTSTGKPSTCSLPLFSEQGTPAAFLEWEAPGFDFPYPVGVPVAMGVFILSMALLTRTVLKKEAKDRIRSERMLTRAKEKAEAADKAKSVFLANMSHDLRTPVNGVMGMLQLLQLGSLDAEQDEYVHAAVRSCRRLTELLRDILDLSKIEAGKLEIAEKHFNLHEALHGLVDMHQPAAREKDIRLNFTMAADVPVEVVGDGHRLAQILANLIGNGIKFTEKGQVSLAVSALRNAKEKVHILFLISDTGIGFPENGFGDLFEPFSQADSGATRKGVGLGLSIVKRLVYAMGGTLCVSDRQGGGASMYLSLPFSLCIAPSGKTAKGRTESKDSGPVKALVVEDDRVNMLVMKRLLGKLGGTTDSAETGYEALELLQKSKYDVVFMDIQLPGLEGTEVVKIIRDSAKFALNAETFFVAVTANALVGAREEYLGNRFDGYLSKPVEVEALRNILAEVSRPA